MNTVAQQTAPNFESVWAAIQETNRQMQETDRRMKELQKQIGGMAYNQGSFAEEYFFNSFERGQKNFFGEKFDDIKNIRFIWVWQV